MNFDPNMLNQALSLTGSSYQVPGNYGASLGNVSAGLTPGTPAPAAAAPAPSAEPATPAAPAVPDYVKKAQEMTKVGGAVSGMSAGDNEGKKNQQQALSKAGALLGAVANFYTGNWAGAAQSASGMFGTSEQQAERKAAQGDAAGAAGMLGGLFGG
jgi:hypothetical protein